MARRLDYRPPRSLEPFLLSEKFITLCCGPLGSTKTTAGIIKIAYHAARMAPCKDGIRRSRAIWIRNCYHPDTEVLTLRGWVRFEDLREDDAVATLDEGSEGTFHFEVPKYIYREHFEGDLLRFEGESFCLTVTPDHWMWASRKLSKGWSPYTHVRAEKVFGTNTYYRFQTYARLNEARAEPRFSEDFAEFLGFFLADGSAGVYDYGSGTRYNIVLVQHEPRLGYLRTLLDRCGFSYTLHERSATPGIVQVRISTASQKMKELCAWLASLGKQQTKRIPDEIMSAPLGHIEAFLRGFQHGDGTLPGSRHKAPDCLRTTSPVMADQLHQLLVMAGYSVRKLVRQDGVRKDGTPKPPMYTLSIHRERGLRPKIRPINCTRVPYKGLVWCVEVSSHVILVREKGKVCLCGQTKEILRDSSIPDFLKWFPDGEWGAYIKSEYRYVLRFGDVECEVLFRSLDDSNDIRRLLSLQASFAILDEFREIHPDIYHAVQGRLGRYPDKSMNGLGCVVDQPAERCQHCWSLLPADDVQKAIDRDEPHVPCPACGKRASSRLSNAKLWGMTNPPDEGTYWGELLMDPPSNVEVIWQPSGMSPEADWLHVLPEGYYETLAQGKSQEWVDVYVHAKLGKGLFGRPVHRQFSRQRHVAEKPLERVPGAPLIIGADAGLRPACLIGQIAPNGRLLVLAELYDECAAYQFIHNRLIPLLRERFPGIPAEIVIDPAAFQRSQTDARTVAQVYQAAGFRVRPARTNALVERIAAVDDLLTRTLDDGKPGLLIDPSCRALVEALGVRYAYRQSRDGETRPTPEKNHPWSDLADSLHYIAMDARVPGSYNLFGVKGFESEPVRVMPAPVRVF